MADEKKRNNLVQMVAFAAILVISLFIAKVIVNIKSVVQMSPAIELKQSGLSVSMPSGNGWQCDNKWIYQDNSFVVRSIFSLQGASQSYAQCIFLLAAEPMTAKERFEQQAAELNGNITQTGQMSSNQLKVEWARITRSGGHQMSITHVQEVETYEIIFGICRLSQGRMLEIEVLTPAEDNDMLFKAFEGIVKNLNFSDNGLLEAGTAIISEIKQSSITQYYSERTQSNAQDLFIYYDKQNRPVGFSIDIAISKPDTNSVRILSYFYQRGFNGYELTGQFTCESFDQFSGEIRNTQRGGRIVEMACKDNSLTVRTATAGHSNEKEYEYYLGPAAISDSLIETVLDKFLDSKTSEMIVDLITFEGSIVPLYITKAEDKKEQFSYAVLTKILNGTDNWQLIYFDENKKIKKRTMRQDGLSTCQRATTQQVIAAFPQKADIINNPVALFEKNN